MFDVNLEPLISQIKEFNTNQVRTNQILTEILLILKKESTACQISKT